MTTTVDPRIRQQVIVMARANCPIAQIGNETGLLDKEIRLIIDADRRMPGATPAPPRLPSGAVRPPIPTVQVAPREPSHIPPQPADSIAALINQAETSDIGKVRTAARRAATAIDQLREVMDATETERREKAAAKAQAEREAAQAAEKTRAAQARVDQLARDLEAARAELAAVTPGKNRGGRKGQKLNITPEDRERRRQHAIAMGKARSAKKAASA